MTEQAVLDDCLVTILSRLNKASEGTLFIIMLTTERRSRCILLGRNGNFAALDFARHVTGRGALNHAAHRRASAQNLQHGALELTSKRLGAVLAGNIHNLVKGQVAVMLD